MFEETFRLYHSAYTSMYFDVYALIIKCFFFTFDYLSRQVMASEKKIWRQIVRESLKNVRFFGSVRKN